MCFILTGKWKRHSTKRIVSDYILGGWLAEILPFIMVVK